MRIACIEDEEAQREYIVNLCNNWALRRGHIISTAEYENAEEFLFKHDAYPYDLLLIDISMGSLNGVELAKAVRSRDDVINIAFITGDRDYAIEGYEVGAVRYLLKPVDEEQLSKLLDIIADKINIASDKDIEAGMIIEYDSMKKVIALKDIMYIEALGHYSEIHMEDGNVYSLKEGINALAKRAGCILCHRSYAVNLGFVESIKKSACTLKGNILKENIELPVSRGCFGPLNEAFLNRYKPGVLWD